MTPLPAWTTISMVRAPLAEASRYSRATSRRRDLLRSPVEATLLAMVNSHVANLAPGSYEPRTR